MRNILLKLLILCGLFSISAQASAVEFVQNGGFEQSTVGPGQKKTFLSANEQFWNGGAGQGTYVGAPGTADNVNLSPYVHAGFPASSPTGGNFVMADTTTGFSLPFSQTIGNLVVGTSYTLTFYQAGAEIFNYNVPTSAWWEVTFGGTTQQSTVMNSPASGFTPWQQQTMSFVASAQSQTLSFLAKGTPDGGPPVAFLDGVSLVNGAVPEPETWAMMIFGLGLVGTAMRRRRSTLAAALG